MSGVGAELISFIFLAANGGLAVYHSLEKNHIAAAFCTGSTLFIAACIFS